MILKTKPAARALKSAVLLASGLSLLAPAAAFAQAAPAKTPAQAAGKGMPPKGWFKACTKQEDNDVCVVQNIVTAPSGQLVTAIGLITVTGKVNRKLLQVSVPSARRIQPGVSMQIDDGQKARLDYGVCMPEDCVASVPLTDAMVASFKKGSNVTFTSVNFQGAANPIKVSLKGFTDAFDGQPMKQSELEQRQKLLQEEMQKKADAARKKLEAAQDAAKSK
ncbi:MAG: invasion associated locus B family protein [Pararhizobium sp.]